MLSVFASLTLIQSQDEIDTSNLLGEQCYCPGNEYAVLEPKLAEAIARVARSKSKSAPIYTVPTPPKPNIPNIDVLRGIAKFSNYNRSQLLDIDEEALASLAQEAQATRQEVVIRNNETFVNDTEAYEQIAAEIEAFNLNMTLKRTLVEAAQESVLDNPAEDILRKKRGMPASYAK